MAASLEDTGVTYEQLADIEAEFDEVETEIIRQQVQMTQPLYEKRQKLVAKIPNFWPLVFEQAPPDIDEFIQPTDSALLLTSLASISVSHFEIENGGNGDPRSVAIRMEFNENEYFEDRVLEKKFWYRRSMEGDAGLVSEPVVINWKEGKDLTDGLLNMVKAVWDEQQQSGPATAAERKKKPLTAKQQALKEKIENIGLGGQSFFCWFGFVGDRISAEESKAATEKERAERKLRQQGGATPADKSNDEDEEDDEFDDLEIFPEGDSVALAITDDLWPGALRYFCKFLKYFLHLEFSY
ncbi:nucleosome assembly protein [Apodospora peruviana]|uniref:Nucleosome assembly protein n=1 Tax=Apodospora peruviana TaxID=516989 RepID=A0AAE0MAW8_9PEZI|nr:nucleosome assembly protein [Apodospora peruviana]